MSDRGDDTSDPQERSKFEWRPEDVTIIEPGDPDYDDDVDASDDREVEDP
jgi:hypothetical protein